MPDEREEYYSLYCPYCEACGEEGCCTALVCKNHPEGDYCDIYLTDLKFSYAVHQEFMVKAELTPEQIAIYHRIWDKKYDFFYKK